MNKKHLRFHLGLRTIKTAVAVIVSMLLVSSYGISDSRMIFAVLGAMNAVQPTFKESVQASFTQIVGVLFGVAVSALLMLLPWNILVITGIGIVLIITLYNTLHITFSPGLPCLLVVILCTTADISPLAYGLSRIWDTAIGLFVGMAINMLVFPYDNSRRIRHTVESLDREVIVFLEDLFDGDEILPDVTVTEKKIDLFKSQLKIFENQKLILRLSSQHKELEMFRLCESKARALVAQMEVLTQMGMPGILSPENRQRLCSAGANIQDTRTYETPSEQDTVTNYHVREILLLRCELINVLKK